jgi:hypothetical protein
MTHSSQIFNLSVENGKNRELDAFNQLVAGKEKKIRSSLDKDFVHQCS